ncbi:hypothetical protein [Streptomyces sp. DH12]|nr:hypothetical protein [Streptomyces sp. DH12]
MRQDTHGTGRPGAVGTRTDRARTGRTGTEPARTGRPGADGCARREARR